MKFRDLSGQKFNKLTAVKRVDSNKKGVFWECICECGNYVVVRNDKLTMGLTKSCGCLKHGKCQSRLYRIWQNMKNRCKNKSHNRFRVYGGKGIKVCPEWVNDFNAFYNWAINNGYEDNLSIDRIDNNGDYTPQNCRWASLEVQANNTSVNHIVEIDGVKHTVAEWSKITGISESVIRYRLNKGWTGKEVTMPLLPPGGDRVSKEGKKRLIDLKKSILASIS